MIEKRDNKNVLLDEKKSFLVKKLKMLVMKIFVPDNVILVQPITKGISFMANSLKTMWTALAVSLAAATSVNAAFFDDGSCCPPADCPCPTSRSLLDPCGNWYFDVEGLAWEACTDGLAYATKESESNSGSGSPGGNDCSTDCDRTIKNRVKNLGSKWDGGFRIGLGCDLPCDEWDFAVTWTWFRTNVKSHENAEGDDRLTASWGRDNLFYRTHEARAHWSLNLNVLDFEFGREFCVSPCLSLRPFMGIRAAWVDQHYKINYKSERFVFPEKPEEGEDGFALTKDESIRMKSRFSGAGVVGGLDSEWKLGCGLSIYGDVAASLLWGKFRRRTHDTESYFDDCENFIGKKCYEQQDNTHTGGCRAITDAAIGLRWRQFFDCDRIALTVSVGWEHHCFFDQNRFENIASPLKPQPQVERGDLYTQGVTVAARLDF